MSLLKYWEALGVWGTRKSRQKDSDLELKQKKMFTPLNCKGNTEHQKFMGRDKT